MDIIGIHVNLSPSNLLNIAITYNDQFSVRLARADGAKLFISLKQL